MDSSVFICETKKPVTQARNGHANFGFFQILIG
jgi:hypothetical protein